MSRQVGRTSATTRVFCRGWVKASRWGVELSQVSHNVIAVYALASAFFVIMAYWTSYEKL
jgi:hypothetical protein